MVLVNEITASGGEYFAWLFKQQNRGPLIGRRSWGGVFAAVDGPRLLDGTQVRVVNVQPQGPSGDIENLGVAINQKVPLIEDAKLLTDDAILETALQRIQSPK